MTETIAEITTDHLGSAASELDVAAFQAAATNYQAATSSSEAEAIDAVFGNGDFWGRCAEWAPKESAEAANQHHYPEREDTEMTTLPRCPHCLCVEGHLADCVLTTNQQAAASERYPTREEWDWAVADASRRGQFRDIPGVGSSNH